MSPRVSIRPYRPDDADDLLAAVHESMGDLSAWMPWCTPEYDRNTATGWIQAVVSAREQGTMYDFAIVADGGFAGAVGLNWINGMDGVANLGYWVRSSLTRRGIATLAVNLLAEWAFENTDLERLEIVVATGNQASQRVAEKAGAARDAILKKRTRVAGKASDAVLYSIIRPD